MLTAEPKQLQVARNAFMSCMFPFSQVGPGSFTQIWASSNLITYYRSEAKASWDAQEMSEMLGLIMHANMPLQCATAEERAS